MRLRILTYNIHKCIGGIDRRYRPDRVLSTIAHYEPHFALLQEVDDGVRRSSFHRQVDLLGDEMGLRHRSFFPNVSVRGGGVYGNAILSRFPVMETENVDLTVARLKRRSVVHARYRVRLPDHRHTRTVHVFNMHLGLAQLEREFQLARFLESAPFAGLHERTPIIIGGDLNDVWGSLGPKLLEPAGFRSPEGPRIRTFPAYAPLRALDGIYVRGDLEFRHVFRAQIAVARQASDHLPLLADVELV